MIGKRIKELREKKGINQKELAKKSGISQGNLSRIELEIHDTTVSRLMKIVKALGVPLESFFHGIKNIFINL